MTYECDQCGACCKHTIIEIDFIDVLREPLLRQASEPFRVPEGFVCADEDGEPIENPDPFAPGAILAAGGNRPCQMLGVDNRCTIYPTRPNCCVGFDAGSELCQESRIAHGLERLQPVNGPSLTSGKTESAELFA